MLTVLVLSVLFQLVNLITGTFGIETILCRASCVARCIESDLSTDCRTYCRNRQRSDIDCPLEKKEVTVEDFVLDHGDPNFQNRPYDTLLTWKGIPGAVYVIQWSTQAALGEWQMYDDVILKTDFVFNHTVGPCSRYWFRIIPVSVAWVGQPSPEKESGQREPHFLSSSDMILDVVEMRQLNKSFVESTIIHKVLRFWKPEDYSVDLEDQPYDCPQSRLIKIAFSNSTVSKALIPSGCVTGFRVARVRTVCGAFSSPVLGQKFTFHDGKKCEKIIGCMNMSACVHAFSCAVDIDLSADEDCYEENVPVNVIWTYNPPKDDEGDILKTYVPCQKIEGVLYGYGYVNRSYIRTPSEVLEYNTLPISTVNNFMDWSVPPNEQNGSNVLNGTKNRNFAARICVIFDRERFFDPIVQAEFPDQFRIARRKSIDLEKIQVCSSPFISSTVLPGIIAPLAAALAVMLIAVCLICRKNRNNAKKLHDTESQLNHYHLFKRPPTEVKDVWEIDRRLLIVREEDCLGRGAFGKVFKGQVVGRAVNAVIASSSITTEQETANNMIVAIKQCHEIADDNTKQDFLHEIDLMKKLYSHARLVNIVYCITETEPYSLVVEYCANGDLLKYLRRRREYMVELQESGIDVSCGTLPENINLDMVLCFRDVASFCYQIADGMEYLAGKGFIHRDLAARNVLVTESNSLKIGDFGLCRYMETDAYTTRGGKLPVKWLALEALQRYEFSSKSDVWSYGVLVFEIITLGGTPYPDVFPDDGDFRVAMLEYLKSGNRLEQPSNCPDELYLLMKDTWRSKPEDRPSFTELKNSLRNLIEELTRSDSGNYSDFYIDPARSYYNVTDDENKTDGSLEKVALPHEESAADLGLQDQPEIKEHLTVCKTDISLRPKTDSDKRSLTNSTSNESGICSDRSTSSSERSMVSEQSSCDRASLSTTISTAPLVSPSVDTKFTLTRTDEPDASRHTKLAAPYSVFDTQLTLYDISEHSEKL